MQTFDRDCIYYFYWDNISKKNQDKISQLALLCWITESIQRSKEDELVEIIHLTLCFTVRFFSILLMLAAIISQYPS